MIGDEIEKELTKEQYKLYLSLLELLDEYEIGQKEAYDEVVTKLCDLCPTHKDEIILSAVKVYELRNQEDDNDLTLDEIDLLLAESPIVRKI
jgi:hypothetical protein